MRDAGIIIIKRSVCSSRQSQEKHYQTLFWSLVYNGEVKEIRIYKTFIFGIEITANHISADEDSWRFDVFLVATRSSENVFPRSFENDPRPLWILVSHLEKIFANVVLETVSRRHSAAHYNNSSPSSENMMEIFPTLAVPQVSGHVIYIMRLGDIGSRNHCSPV